MTKKKRIKVEKSRFNLKIELNSIFLKKKNYVFHQRKNFVVIEKKDFTSEEKKGNISYESDGIYLNIINYGIDYLLNLRLL
jgi:hypothetical protein